MKTALFFVLASFILAAQPASAEDWSVPTFLLKNPSEKRDIGTAPTRHVFDADVSYTYIPGAPNDVISGAGYYRYLASDRIDIVGSATASYSDDDFAEYKTGGAGIGLAYWVQSNWSITAKGEFGMGWLDPGGELRRNGFSDLWFTVWTVSLDSEFFLPLGKDTWLLVGNRLGHSEAEVVKGRHLVDGPLRQEAQFLAHRIGFDAPVASHSGKTYRIRTNLGYTHDLDEIDQGTITVGASLRITDAATRLDSWKAGVSYSWWSAYDIDSGFTTFTLSRQF